MRGTTVTNGGESMKFKETSYIIAQERIASDVYSMWIRTEKIAKAALPGQFISVYSNDSSRLLPRPISICEVDREQKALRIVYRVVGKGTAEFSKMKAAETLEILGPLGNGFPIERCKKGKKPLLIAGGIGIPPMVWLARELQGEIQIAAGYRDEIFLEKELETNGRLYIATEDGSHGTKGNVLDAVEDHHLEADVMFACGPAPMLRALKKYALEKNIECWLSLEERMACGVGACLACVCKTKEVDPHSNVHNKRICEDGPVFLSTEVEL